MVLEIRRLIKDLDFNHHLNHREFPAWESFMQVIESFVGNRRDDSFPKYVGDLLSACHKMGCCMSMKMNFLFSSGKSKPKRSVTPFRQKIYCRNGVPVESYIHFNHVLSRFNFFYPGLTFYPS